MKWILFARHWYLGLFLVLGICSLSFCGDGFSSAQGTPPLPNDAGQYWVQYDLTPYTSLFPSLPHPEQTIINWILFDTGESFWVGEPFGFLSSNRQSLCVYHTEKVHQYVSNVLNRFLDAQKKSQLYTIRIVTVDTPDWRTSGAEWIRPYPAKADGISCWIMDGTGFRSLFQSLSRRSDFSELNTSRDLVPNAETFGWVFPAPRREYARDIQVVPGGQGIVADKTAIDEGYRIEVTPLLSTNGDQIEILFSCDATVVEKFLTFTLKVPTSQSPRQQLNGQTPQIASRKIKDKIAFPRDKILLIDLGMIPIPEQTKTESSGITEGITKMISGKSVWKDLLIFVEGNGAAPN